MKLALLERQDALGGGVAVLGVELRGGGCNDPPTQPHHIPTPLRKDLVPLPIVRLALAGVMLPAIQTASPA